MKYPKINSLWKRDGEGKIIEGNYSRPEFASIKYWTVTEKIDGMNIRIIFKNGKISIRGRNDKTEIPYNLKKHINERIKKEKLQEIFKDSKEVVLFGEGYGGKIQSGGLYGEEEKFILFDVWIDGWWLDYDKVFDIAEQLNIRHVPFYEWKSETFVIGKVKRGFQSLLSKDKQAEGLVAKSYPLMLFRNGTPIIWKLKTKDFK
jgi:ATP-dependent RNA circularization protein (DNA/RNA ligase family)